MQISIRLIPPKQRSDSTTASVTRPPAFGDGADIDPEPERRHGHHGEERRGMFDRRDRDGGHQPDRSVVRFAIWPMTSVDRRLSDR